MNARLFLTDYGSYNNGTQFQFGHWVDLSDFSDVDDFLQYCKEHFEEADEKSPLTCGTPREEIMFTDFEGFPKELYSESLNEHEIQKIYDFIELDIDLEDEEQLMYAAQEYLEDVVIYENDEEFFNTFFNSPMDAVRAAVYGEYNFMDKYVTFNGYGNLKSSNYISDLVNECDVLDAILETL